MSVRRFSRTVAERMRLAVMGEVKRPFQAPLVRFAIENPISADARWCFDQYFAELEMRFEDGFNPARSTAVDPREITPPQGLLVIARLGERAVGCGALKLHRDAPAELKRMWVAPAVRGLGVGRRLLAELERHARNARASAIRLETNRALTEAIELYRRSGYIEVARFNAEPYAHHWFEKRFE